MQVADLGTDLGVVGVSERFKLPTDDMAFRKIYRELLEREALTTVFRPGERGCGAFRGYCPGTIVNARIINQLGCDRTETPPIFLESPVKKIRIEEIQIKPLRALRSDDFVGSSPDVHDKQSLIMHLGVIYNLDPSSLTDDALITRIHFSFT